MQIVIDIPKIMYGAIKEYGITFLSRDDKKTLRKSIANGTPLPEHHGRLIDADAYRKELMTEIPNLDYDGSLEPYEEGIYSAIMSLDDAPTIIEGSESE